MILKKSANTANTSIASTSQQMSNPFDSAGIPPKKPEVSIEQFVALDMRAGTIVSAMLNPKAKKPSFVLDIDLGGLGLVKSSAQLVDNYTAETLRGKRVVVVINFPPRNVAGVKSEVLVLANLCPKGGTLLLDVAPHVENGAPVA